MARQSKILSRKHKSPQRRLWQLWLYSQNEKLACEHCDGAAVPLYYFETEGRGWSDYQDDDGIELESDAEALAYGYSMIRELNADYESSQRPLHLLVKNWIRKTIFRIAFE